MELLIRSQVSKGRLQVLDQLPIEGVMYFWTPHGDGGNLILEAAFNGDVCICHYKYLLHLSYIHQDLGARLRALCSFYILNTPNGVSGIGALRDAAIPRASTVRVSRGSIMP